VNYYIIFACFSLSKAVLRIRIQDPFLSVLGSGSVSYSNELTKSTARENKFNKKCLLVASKTRIRIRITVRSSIRIRIKMVWIGNTAAKFENL
jgi:hypothetical protein